MTRNIPRARRLVVPLLALGLVAAACGGDDDSTDADEASTDDTSATAEGSDTSTASSGAEGGEPADLGSVKVGLVCGGMTPIVAQIAMNTDAFADAGLEVEKVCFDGGSEGVQALIGGSLDVFLGSFEHVATTRQEGLDTKGFAVINDVFPYWALTKKDASFESAADLAGETVGVTSPGSLSETGLTAALADADVSVDDVKIIGSGSGSTMRSALDADHIAAGMVSEPEISELTLGGDYRILWEPPFPYVSIVVLGSEGWASDNGDTLSAFLDVLTETAKKAKSDTAWAVEAMAEEGFEVDEAALEAAVKRTLNGVPNDLKVSAADVKSTADLLVSLEKLDEPLTIDEGFDFSYLDS